MGNLTRANIDINDEGDLQCFEEIKSNYGGDLNCKGK